MTDTQTSKRFQILSLDGGGLKGLFSAALLAKWEEEQETRVVDHFDLIAGTSTGGIIALGLGLGFSAAEIMDLYLSKADLIFLHSMLGDAKHWLDVKYSSEGLKTALEGLLKDRKLGESKTRLIIPAFDPKFEGIHIFKTPHHRRLQTDYKETAVHVALATSAAPTYFDPHVKESGLELVDGGVWANNPVMLAVAEGLGYLEEEQEDIAALRIGTTDEVYSVEQIKSSGGKIAMAGPLINFMMRGQSQSASGMVYHMLGGDRYHEINPKVAAGDFKLDKLSKELVALADAQWRHQSSELMDKGFFAHKAQPYTPSYSV
jgi:patatin-like phospholipase/acyl hydrolase